jgi:hypothetical protein
LTAAATGTVAVRATIANGLAQGQAYTQDFEIAIDNRVVVPGDTLLAKLQWITANVQSGVNYIVTAPQATENLSPQTLAYTDRNNVTITLQGGDTEKVIQLQGNGTLFTLSNGVTLVLDNNVTLRGHSGNNRSMIWLNGGTLVMKDSSQITGNTSSFSNPISNGAAAAVSAAGSGTFIMEGGRIHDNHINEFSTRHNTPHTNSVYAAGVTVTNNSSSGVFTKSGGTIYGYTASDTVNSNVIRIGNGHGHFNVTIPTNRGSAVWVDSSPAKRRETTAGSAVNMDSHVAGFAGGCSRRLALLYEYEDLCYT